MHGSVSQPPIGRDKHRSQSVRDREIAGVVDREPPSQSDPVRSRHELPSGDDFQGEANESLQDRAGTLLGDESSSDVAGKRVRSLRKDEIRGKAFDVACDEPVDPLDRRAARLRSHDASDESARVEDRANGRRGPRG